MTARRYELTRFVGADTEYDPAERLEAKAAVVHYAADKAERYELYQMLGLDQLPEPVSEPERMIAPQLRYQRARGTKGRHA